MSNGEKFKLWPLPLLTEEISKSVKYLFFSTLQQLLKESLKTLLGLVTLNQYCQGIRSYWFLIIIYYSERMQSQYYDKGNYF